MDPKLDVRTVVSGLRSPTTMAFIGEDDILVLEEDREIRRSAVMNLRQQTYLWYIVILRLYIGYYLLQQGILKYLRGFPQSDWINRQIGDLNKVEIFSWYKSFLINVVVPIGNCLGIL